MTKKTIDYLDLMPETSEIGKFPIRFIRCAPGQNIELLPFSRYSFLFVLRGELQCSFKTNNQVQIKKSEVIVVDKEQITQLKCPEESVILECAASGRMVPLMKGTSEAFSTPCSEIIPLNNKIKAWCKNLFADTISDPCRDNDYYHEQCSTLTTLLLGYPKNVLGTLYIPLYACTLQCNSCSKQFSLDSNSAVSTSVGG